jgi:hypothetical protein
MVTYPQTSPFDWPSPGNKWRVCRWCHLYEENAEKLFRKWARETCRTNPDAIDNDYNQGLKDALCMLGWEIRVERVERIRKIRYNQDRLIRGYAWESPRRYFRWARVHAMKGRWVP